MEPIESKHFNDPVIVLEILEDGRLLVVDSKTNIRYLKLETMETEGGFKTGVHHERYANRVVSFSKDGVFFALIANEGKEARLYNASTKKFVAKVDRHHGSVSCVGVDPQGHYMFSCGEDGKTFVVDIQTAKLAFTLPVHRDTIEDIAFSPNAQYVATGSFDRRILLFNLSLMAPKAHLKAHTAPIAKLLFIDTHRLVSIDKKNTAIVWDVAHAKVLCRLEGIHDDVSCLACSTDKRFLFLGTKLGYVLAYDLATYKLLSHKYIKRDASITAMVFDGDREHLYVGGEDGTLLCYDIFEGREQMQEVLQEKRYALIEKQIEANPLLVYTKPFLLFSALWERTLQKGVEYLQQGDTKAAQKMFERFREIPSRNKIIHKVFAEYQEYPKFVALVEHKKLPLAYSLAATHPMYKESPLYLKLEEEWKKTFAAAQKLSLDPKNGEKVKEMLAPYRGIPQKSQLIQELLSKSNIYMRFRVALGQQDFVVVFELIKQNPFLKEFPEYEALMAYADSLYIKAQKLLEADDTHAAVKIFRTLRSFPDFEPEALDAIKEIECRQRFFTALDDKDTAKAYNLLAVCETLQNTNEGKALQEAWNADLAHANRCAVEGNVEGIKTALESYMHISSKYRSLATVFGWCYMTQLEHAMKKKAGKLLIEKGIKNYILNFGLNDQIMSLAAIFEQHYPESKLNFELLTQGSMAMWRPAMIVNSILE
jgi:hypothetical protein